MLISVSYPQYPQVWIRNGGKSGVKCHGQPKSGEKW